MKKMFGLMLFVITIFLFSSCEKDEQPNYYAQPMFVNEAPEKNADNKNEAYVELSDLEAAEYMGNRTIRYQSWYINEDGEKVFEQYNYNVVLYKIKVRKYWGWLDNIQYASTYKEELQIESSQVAEINERLKNTGYVICYKCLLQDEENFFGLEKKICGIK